MNHLSIAIIKKQIVAKSNDFSNKFDYLVLKEGSKYKFFDYKSNAIGDRFRFTDFKNKIISYFGLRDINDKNEKIDFEKPPRLFKTSKNDPYATSYEYILSNEQIERIDQKLPSNEGVWNNIVWLSEEELLAKKDNWLTNQNFIFKTETPFQTPNFSNKLRESLKNIVEAKKNGKLVIFTGAGVSIDSGVPGWWRLIQELKAGIDGDEEDFLKVGQLYYDSRGKKEYNSRVQEILKHGVTKYNPIHQKIVELQPHHIISTNYDSHFEQIFEQKSYRYSVIKKDTDLPYSNGSSLFVKMHGDFDERNIVLKEKDYEQYSENFPLIEGFIKGIFASKLVLFVGFSFTDPNLEHITNSVKNILKEDNQPPYLFIIQDKKDKNYKERKRKLEKKGLIIVEYEDLPINKYFEGITSDEESIQLKELSPTGQKVFKFLKTIEEFDVFSDTIENLNVKDQLINSVLRFKELGAIPLSVIEKISPFKLQKKAQYELNTSASYNYPAIETLNEDLLSFLKDEKGDMDNIVLKPINDKTIKPEKQELHKALNLLCSSGVFAVGRKNDTSPSYIKFHVENNENCNCPKCLFGRFEIGNLLQELYSTASKAICKSTNQNIGFEEAWGFQKMGQFAKAYFTLEEMKSKSWRKKEYVSFFIASYNQTLLYPFLRSWDIMDLNENELEDIQIKIKKIDLDKILFELPIDISIKEALVAIKENKLFESSRIIIERNYSTIKDTYDKYKDGNYYSMGPAYWHEAETTFYILWIFYKNNSLFNEEYKYFIDLANRYLESMLMSYSTNIQYKQKLPNFSELFVITFITLGNTKELASHLKTYDVKTLKFENNKKTLNNIFESFESFITSGYEINTIFSRKINNNKLYSRALKDSDLFKSKMVRSLNNFLVLFTKIDLSNSQVNEVLDKILNYLEVNSIYEYHDSFSYFSLFSVQYINSFNEQNIFRLLNYIVSKHIGTNSLVEPICDAIINKQGNEQILGEEFYIQLLQCKDKKKIAPFFRLLNKEQQTKYLKLIKPSLDNNKLIQYLYNWGVWELRNESSIFDKYVANLYLACKGFPDYEINNDGFPNNIKSTSVWNQLHFYVNLIYKNQLFDMESINDIHSSIDSEMFKWILKPDAFDYSKFNLNWILSFDRPHIMEHIGKSRDLKTAVKKGLSRNYNVNVAKIYFEKLLTEQVESTMPQHTL
ncbi:SIR2 family protein [Labilibaculum antarcticum]|uniref:Deacetylase sirtuin-type domain-containing protein n=1 Tax=Labilibaculum antarcticum TaxID=1717717 RepID=A0A1Y1CGK5_9BACT|nr:SIR2 family protein [Labilibaculum antarcticum]BAX78421.1 hypothetical protein ALGA_0026 [Labilibaculum antarcticum]